MRFFSGLFHGNIFESIYQVGVFIYMRLDSMFRCTKVCKTFASFIFQGTVQIRKNTNTVHVSSIEYFRETPSKTVYVWLCILRFRDRRFVALSMVSIWILASLVAAPTVWARQWNENPISVWTSTHQTATVMELDVRRNTLCLILLLLILLIFI